MDNSSDKILDLDVEDVVYRGRGLARVDGMVCFVPGVLPGERVRARITQRHSRYMNAELVEILAPSPARVAPVCPLAFAPGLTLPCPGCAYQHADYGEELRLKQAQLAEMLGHQTGLSGSCFAPPVPSPLETGYRNKIVIHEDSSRGRRVMGYIGQDNRTIVDIGSCPLAVPEINAAIESVRNELLPAGAAGRKGRSEHTFRYTERDGTIHFTSRPGRRETWLTETTALGGLRVPRGSFFQVNSALTGHLIAAIEECLASGGTDRVLDLYCGVGIFALAAARAGALEVQGIDGDRDAIRAAEHNARQADLGSRIHFLAAPAGAGLRRALEGTSPAGLTLIADPPRGGLDKEVIGMIRDTPPRRFIYISCAADTLARDLRELVDAGYQVERVQLFDMFPRTALFETMVVLSRVER